jgi:hypothetical protein
MAARGARVTADRESATAIVQEFALPDRTVRAHQVHCFSQWPTSTKYTAGLYISAFHL